MTTAASPPPSPGAPERPERSAPAVVLLSGGLDSATCLAIARADGFAPIAITFRYGQRHSVEITAAAGIAAAAGVELVVVDLDLRTFGASALTADIEVPKHDDIDALEADAAGPDVPITYVPARNTIFLSFALALAEVRGARDIYIGVNALDYSGYPDCRPEYIEAYEQMANLATRAGVIGAASGDDSRLRVRTPLIDLTKGQIIARGLELGVDYGATTSCYDPVGSADGSWLACGHCDSCLLRRKGFAEIGATDPIGYVA